MDNWNYPEGSDNQYAPWNEPSLPSCPECEADEVEMENDGFRCLECGCEWEYEEPDYDPEDYEDWDN